MAGAVPMSNRHDLDFIRAVVERWRGASSRKTTAVPSMPSDGNERLAPLSPPTLQPSLGLDPDRFRLLKKPLR
jgi:hypothetical protein